MKLNFWQWLGAILFVLGLIFMIIRESSKPSGAEKPAAPSAPNAAPTNSNVPATTMTSP
jgi:hypothetical protein